MKGIVLAGGSGTRLHPITQGVSQAAAPGLRQADGLLPALDADAGGHPRVLLISTPEDLPAFERLLGDGSRFGIELSLRGAAAARGPRAGLPDRARLRRRATASRSRSATTSSTATACPSCSSAPTARARGATVFGYWVRDPERYGVVEFDEGRPRARHRGEARGAALELGRDRALLLRQPRARHRGGAQALAARRARDHRREPRLPASGELHVELLGRGIAWLDTGTHESLLQASNFVQTIQERQGLKIACLEEIAYRKGYLVARAAGRARQGDGQVELRRVPAADRAARTASRCASCRPPLPGVILIEPDVHRDARGFFLETYHAARYREGGIHEAFVQDNHSRSARGTLRGLHAQLPQRRRASSCA